MLRNASYLLCGLFLVAFLAGCRPADSQPTLADQAQAETPQGPTTAQPMSVGQAAAGTAYQAAPGPGQQTNPTGTAPSSQGAKPARSPVARLPKPAQPSAIQTGQARSRMVQALLKALDEIKGESQEDKDQVRKMLLAADDDLVEILGENSRKRILAANKKPPIPVVGGFAKPTAKPSGAQPGGAPAKPAAAPAKSAVPPAAAGPGEAAGDPGTEPQTRIVRALIKAIDEATGESAEVKKDLKRSLLEADRELRGVLGKNSQRKILEANKKPAVPVVGRPSEPPAKKGSPAGRP